jgi:hypothetical protein
MSFTVPYYPENPAFVMHIMYSIINFGHGYIPWSTNNTKGRRLDKIDRLWEGQHRLLVSLSPNEYRRGDESDKE